MIFGYLDDNSRIHISEYTEDMKTKIFCGEGHPIVARKGDVRIHHFAHKNKCDCKYSNGMTDWHSSWQDRVDKKYQEIRLIKDGKLHIADVLINGHIVEFQHSVISKEDVREREAFYSNYGTLVWVFDTSSWGYSLTRNKSSLVLRKTRGPDFPLHASFTSPIIKILDFGKRDLFVVTSQKGSMLTGYTINMVEFDRTYLGIDSTTNDIRPFHHPL